jgi:hypothetical protein
MGGMIAYDGPSRPSAISRCTVRKSLSKRLFMNTARSLPDDFDRAINSSHSLDVTHIGLSDPAKLIVQNKYMHVTAVATNQTCRPKKYARKGE